MARIVRPFTFTHANGKQQTFSVGDPIPDVIADHWFVRYHTDDPPPVKDPVFGTPAYVQREAERLERQRYLAAKEAEEVAEKRRAAVTAAGATVASSPAEIAKAGASTEPPTEADRAKMAEADAAAVELANKASKASKKNGG